MALQINFHPTSGWTTPVFPVYNDQTHLITSTNSKRRDYKALVDVNLNDNKVGTLKCFPFNGIIEANPALSQNYLLHNFNYDITGCVSNNDSIKKINIAVGESYSRVLSYSAITSGSGYFYPTVNVQFDSGHNLTINDRVYLVPANDTINPQYKNYWKVLSTNATSVELDCPYLYTPARESGICYEGVEFFDYAYNSDGNLAITTSQPHYFNSGDTITLVMDGYSTAKIRLEGTGGTISQIKVNGTDILGGAVAYTTSLAQTCNNIATQINLTNSEYSAYHYSGSNIFHIYSFRTSGATTNGYPVQVVSSGFDAVVWSPSMFINRRQDSATLQGWNPQFSNIYTIKDITSPTSFTLTSQMLNGLDNQPGSQRGSIISSNLYSFSAIVTGDTYFVMNGSNLYEYNDYSSIINQYQPRNSSSKFLSTIPRTSLRYYSTKDIGTFDILYNTQGNTSGESVIKNLVIATFSGNNAVQGVYSVNVESTLSSYSSDTTWRRISFGTGAWNLNNIPTSAITVHTANPIVDGMIDENVNQYKVWTISAATYNVFTLLTSEQLTYNRQCSPHLYHQIIFLNKFGCYEYCSVTANFQPTLNIERSTFNKKRESVKSASNYGIENESRGNTVDISLKLTTLFYCKLTTPNRLPFSGSFSG